MNCVLVCPLFIKECVPSLKSNVSSFLLPLSCRIKGGNEIQKGRHFIFMKNLIKDLFNVDEGQIEHFESHNDEEGNIIIHLRLKPISDPLLCPVCGNKLCGNGITEKKINHKILADRNCKLFYEARRYRCKKCDYSQYDRVGGIKTKDSSFCFNSDLSHHRTYGSVYGGSINLTSNTSFGVVI